MTIRRRAILATLAFALLPSVHAAQGYPQKNVQYIIPFVPGGESDVMARWQQTVFRRSTSSELIVVNKPGAGGGLAWSQMNSMTARRLHDRRAVNLPHIVLQPLEGTCSTRPRTSRRSTCFTTPRTRIVVPADSPYKTFADLVKAAQGEARTAHLRRLGYLLGEPPRPREIQSLHWRCKTHLRAVQGHRRARDGGAGQAHHRRDVLLPAAMQQKGRMRMLAVALDKRHPEFPDVPTFKELGYKWVDGAYRGVAVPKPTPVEARRQVSDMMAALNKDPQILKWMADGGFEVVDIPYEQECRLREGAQQGIPGGRQTHEPRQVAPAAGGHGLSVRRRARSGR